MTTHVHVVQAPEPGVGTLIASNRAERWDTLPAGDEGAVLTMLAGLPAWATAPAGGLAIGDTVSGGTAGSVLWLDTGGVLAQDPTHLSYDASGNVLLATKAVFAPDANADTFDDQRLVAIVGTQSIPVQDFSTTVGLTVLATGDIPASGILYNAVIGIESQARTPASNVNDYFDVYGYEAQAIHSGSGTITGGLYGLSLAVKTDSGAGPVETLYGADLFFQLHSAVTTGWGIQIEAPNTSSTIGTWVALHANDLAGVSANAYYAWFDSRGVRRVREDSTFDSVGQAIEVLYNPQFPKYTAGAHAYERVVLGQWNGNVAEIGNERGPTQTVTSMTRSGATATATLAGHGYRTNDSVTIAGAEQSDYNGTFTVTVASSSTFTYTVSGTPATPATGTLTAQSGTLRSLRLLGSAVQVGTGSVDAAAAVQVDSTTKGLLPPRMTSTQRDAITSPPAGLVVFNSTTGKINVRGNAAWEAVTSI